MKSHNCCWWRLMVVSWPAPGSRCHTQQGDASLTTIGKTPVSARRHGHSSGAIFIIADHVADAIRAAAVPVEMDVLLRDHLLLSA
jgi:hypothetical protein